jgi:hypothetical protein
MAPQSPALRSEGTSEATGNSEETCDGTRVVEVTQRGNLVRLRRSAQSLGLLPPPRLPVRPQRGGNRAAVQGKEQAVNDLDLGVPAVTMAAATKAR